MEKLTKEEILVEIYKHKPASIHDVIPSEFFTKYDSYDYVWSGNCFEWYYAVAKALQPKTFMEIGVRFGFSFLPTLLGSDKLEYALGWDLETYGNNQIANENIGKYYKGPAAWEIKHIDSQLETELPARFDFISIDDEALLLSADRLKRIKDLVEKNAIKLVNGRVFAFDQMVEAHKYVELGHKKGNVAVTVNTFGVISLAVNVGCVKL
jgi:hypothetical protein